MTKMKFIKGGVTAPQGFTANGMKAGIKQSGKKDLSLIYSDTLCTAAGVFTTNKVQASCVVVNTKRLKAGKAQAVIVNSGNANCLTGKKGFEDSLTMAGKTADILGLSESHVCVASTGVIGKLLPIKKIVSALPKLAAGLSKAGGKAAAEGIMTTDHVAKEAAVEVVIGNPPSRKASARQGKIRIGAMTKGGGMIHPQMALPGASAKGYGGPKHATMLCFASTDAAIALPALRAALDQAVQKTFNMITVDGDMSTNDMVLILANGQAKNKLIVKGTKDFRAFESALESLFLSLAKMMIKDAEGATKFVEINVAGAASERDARMVAKSVAGSTLVKTALFGGDPNWGRIAAAAGYSGARVDMWKMKIRLGNLLVLQGGGGAQKDEKAAARILAKSQVPITVDLGVGKHGATAYTCDLSTDYVIFNSAYRT